MFLLLLLIPISIFLFLLSIRPSQLAGLKQDAAFIGQSLISYCLADYLRIRMQQFLGFSIALAGCLGLFAAMAVAYLIWGPGKLKTGTYFALVLLGPLAIFVILR
jgi:hypothetical protein